MLLHRDIARCLLATWPAGLLPPGIAPPSAFAASCLLKKIGTDAMVLEIHCRDTEKLHLVEKPTPCWKGSVPLSQQEPEWLWAPDFVNPLFKRVPMILGHRFVLLTLLHQATTWE